MISRNFGHLSPFLRQGDLRIMELSLLLPGTFSFENFRSRERKWHGTFVSRNFHYLEISLLQPK